MNNLKSLFVFLLLSLSSLAALAMPSVVDVETTIASGDYAKAKTQLEEVLKANPNSYIANRYMLEIIRIENARDNQPSVGYKIYEDRLKQIETAKRARIEAERKEAFGRGVWTFFKFLFILLLVAGIAFIAILFIRKQHTKKEQQREREALTKWKGDVRPDLIDINAILKNVLANLSDFNLSTYGVSLLRDLDADNMDALGALENDDFNQSAIERHISNAFEFIEQHGLKV